jgi:hypothetical protein
MSQEKGSSSAVERLTRQAIIRQLEEIERLVVDRDFEGATAMALKLTDQLAELKGDNERPPTRA